MATARWKGPDVLVVGWIPFGTTPPSSLGYPPSAATTLLFQSGNPQPPIAFAGYPGYANWLHPRNPVGTREYRAALYLEGVAAEFPDSGAPPRADRTANGSFVGYTPLRLYMGGVNLTTIWPQFAQYKKGTGPVYPVTLKEDPAGSWVELHYRAEFKLSWLTNLFSYALVRAWAPYAWCEITYRFDKSGSISIAVEGSARPEPMAVHRLGEAGGESRRQYLPGIRHDFGEPGRGHGLHPDRGVGMQTRPGHEAPDLAGPGSPVVI